MGEGVWRIDPGGGISRPKPGLQKTPKFTFSLSRLEEGLRKLSANLLRYLSLECFQLDFAAAWTCRKRRDLEVFS